VIPARLERATHPACAGLLYPTLVIPARLERATHSLEGCCSIQLSYGTMPAAKIQLFIFAASFRTPVAGYRLPGADHDSKVFQFEQITCNRQHATNNLFTYYCYSDFI
jgi:hypothetical protein